MPKNEVIDIGTKSPVTVDELDVILDTIIDKYQEAQDKDKRLVVIWEIRERE